MARRSRRNELARVAAPAAFLLAVTIAVLLIRAGLGGGGAATTASVPTVPPATRAVTSTTRAPAPPAATTTAAAEFHTVESGDTFGSIAAKYGTTVEALQTLNPGVSSNSLTVGQRIHVK